MLVKKIYIFLLLFRDEAKKSETSNRYMYLIHDNVCSSHSNEDKIYGYEAKWLWFTHRLDFPPYFLCNALCM